MDLDALRTLGIDISNRAMDRDAARRDLWPRDTLGLREGELPDAPRAVAWPRSAEQVAALLAAAAESGTPVVPYGAGSGVCGAAAGRSDALVIDLKRMNRVLEVDPDRGTARLQPGLLGQHMEEALAEQGCMTAHSPSSIMCSTVGGYVAARSAGQFSSRYGVFDDMTLGLRVQTPSGPLSCGTWTPAGDEDLLPVITGSEGGLGVITEALVRVVPLPRTRWLRGAAFRDLPAAWEAMRALLQADLWPSVLRLYDPLDTRIGGPSRKQRGRTSVIRRLRNVVGSTPSTHRLLLELPLSLPRLTNRLATGLGDEVLLIVGFEGEPEVVEAAVRAAGPILADGRDLGPGPGETWFSHRHEVSYKLAPIFMAGAWADTMEVASSWTNLPALYEGVRTAIGEHALVMAHFSHAYREGCSIYFSFAGSGSTEVYDAVWTAGLEAVRAAGGTVTHHHGVGQLKCHQAALEQGAAVRVWRDIQRRLDPARIMNPDRLFPTAPERPGPPPPRGGPVFSVDRISLLAAVDPAANPAEIQTRLGRDGLTLRLPPDRPLGDWLRALRRGALDPWATPLFGVQARFDDGVSARLGFAPRSAAGPDLRWGLLRRARVEMVEVPVRPVGAPPTVVTAPSERYTAEQVRPAWRTPSAWGFCGPAAADVAQLLGSPAEDAPPPSIPPTGHLAPATSAPEAP